MSKHGIGALRAAQVGKAFDAATGTKDKRAAAVGKQFGLKPSTVLNYAYAARKAKPLTVGLSVRDANLPKQAHCAAKLSERDAYATRLHQVVTDELTTLDQMIAKFVGLSPTSQKWFIAWCIGNVGESHVVHLA